MTAEEFPIAYSALEPGVPVEARSGRPFGTVERVLAVEAEDIFRGIVVATAAGPRFVDRDRVDQITTHRVRCAVDDDDVAGLPGPPAATPGVELSAADLPPRSAVVAIVRCHRGALFETLWVPLVSIKAIRLGPWRIQRCPVHRRVELVRWIDPATLTRAERAAAARYPADPIP